MFSNKSKISKSLKIDKNIPEIFKIKENKKLIHKNINKNIQIKNVKNNKIRVNKNKIKKVKNNKIKKINNNLYKNKNKNKNIINNNIKNNLIKNKKINKNQISKIDIFNKIKFNNKKNQISKIDKRIINNKINKYIYKLKDDVIKIKKSLKIDDFRFKSKKIAIKDDNETNDSNSNETENKTENINIKETENKTNNENMPETTSVLEHVKDLDERKVKMANQLNTLVKDNNITDSTKINEIKELLDKFIIKHKTNGN